MNKPYEFNANGFTVTEKLFTSNGLQVGIGYSVPIPGEPHRSAGIMGKITKLYVVTSPGFEKSFPSQMEAENYATQYPAAAGSRMPDGELLCNLVGRSPQ